MKPILRQFSAAIGARMPLAGRRVLDVGCGDGALARELARAGAQVSGIECSTVQLELAQRAPRVGGEVYREGVGQDLPFEDRTFDATAFRASLHHVPADAMTQALREARRVTRPEGELFVFEPLASGTFFALVRLVDDETVVRAQAQEAIGRAVAEGWLTRTHTAMLMDELVLDSLEAFRGRVVAIDASRAARFETARAELQRLLESTGAPCESGRMFSQPFRLDVLR